MTEDEIDENLALEILRLFDEPDREGLDLHTFFEFVAKDDPDKKGAILDIVDRLVESELLESRGSDFYTLTKKGMRAAAGGRLDDL